MLKKSNDANRLVAFKHILIEQNKNVVTQLKKLTALGKPTCI